MVLEYPEEDVLIISLDRDRLQAYPEHYMNGFVEKITSMNENYRRHPAEQSAVLGLRKLVR